MQITRFGGVRKTAFWGYKKNSVLWRGSFPVARRRPKIRSVPQRANGGAMVVHSWDGFAGGARDDLPDGDSNEDTEIGYAAW